MKRAFAALLIFLICLSFAACVGAGQNGTPTVQPTADVMNTAGATEPAKTVEPAATVDPNYHYLTYEEVYNPETDFNNDLAHGYSTILSTGDAYYYAGSSGQYMYYFDKQTGEYDVLCSKPECMHDYIIDNKGCDGYIRSIGMTINLYNGRIRFSQMDNLGEYSMYSMALDGTGREKLFSIAKEDNYYAPMRGAIHRGKLYGSQWGRLVRDAEPVCYWNVTCWDIDTGEYKVICEDANPDGWTEPWMYFFGKYVYICAAYTESEFDEENEVMIYGDSHIKAYRYDTETEQLETLCDIKAPGYHIGSYTICAAAEDRVYVASVGGGPVYQVKDGKPVELFDAKDSSRLTLFADKVVATNFENLDSREISDRRMHIVVYDYEGNIVLEGTADFDTLLNEYDNTISIGCCGAYAFDGAIFVDYSIDLDAKGNESDSMTCLVKYDLVDGKLVDTIIATSKWG